jgi:hypothetical protein
VRAQIVQDLPDAFRLRVVLVGARASSLDAMSADVGPIGDITCVEIVIKCRPTDSVNIILLQLNRMKMREGTIVPTKSFPDCTQCLSFPKA